MLSEYYARLQQRVSGMSMRDKRDLFTVIRKASEAGDACVESALVSRHGFTVGEFALVYLLSVSSRTRRSSAHAAASGNNEDDYNNNSSYGHDDANNYDEDALEDDDQ
jgi:hypothetical protein